MSERIKIRSLTRTCRACPAQWDGETDDGRKVYVRFRWGRLSIRIGLVGDHSEFAAVRGEEIFTIDTGGGFNGRLDFSELKAMAGKTLEFPDKEIEET
jgi:hypothetical protein